MASSGSARNKVAPIPLTGSLPPPTTATTVTTITVAPNKAAAASSPQPSSAAAANGAAAAANGTLPPEKLTPALIDRFILKFKQHPSLEAEFQQSYAGKYFDSSRKAYFSALWLSLCLAVNDIIWPDHPDTTDIIRDHLNITLPLRAAVFVVSMIVYFVFRHSQYIQEAFGFCVCLMGCQQIVGGVIEDDALAPTYSVIILLMASMTASYFRLRYLVCLAITWSLFIAWVILTAVLRPYQSNHQYEIAVIVIFIGDCIFSAQAYQREYYIRVGFLRGKSLVREEQKSQQILAEMLPQSVITKLRAGVDFIYEKHRRTSILFSHICDFDNHTATMSARDVVALLNNLFSGFDLITDDYGVYKVETIGDVYLVSAGCPTPRADHATVLCYLALDMMRSMSQFQMANHDAINLRVGIHSGEVIAGVVGAKYPRYRLMGDTMNTASRMSTTCGDGDIQISEKAKNELAAQGHHIVFHERGQIQVKGKGLMTTFLVTGVVDEAHQESCKHGKIQRRGITLEPSTAATAAAKVEADVLKSNGDNDEAKTSRLPKGGSKAMDHDRRASRELTSQKRDNNEVKNDEKVTIITTGNGNPPANSTRVSPTSEGGGSAAVSPLPGTSTINGITSVGNGQHNGSDTARITHTESDAKEQKDTPLVSGAEAMAAITSGGTITGPMSPGGPDEKAQDEAYQAYLAAQIISTAETLKKTIPQEVHKARKISVLEKLGVGSATAGGPAGPLPRGKPSMSGVTSGRNGPNGWNQGGLNGVDEEDDDIGGNGAGGTKQLSTILRLLDKDDKGMERKGSFGNNPGTPGAAGGGKRSGISPMWLNQQSGAGDDVDGDNGVSARSARNGNGQSAMTASSRRVMEKNEKPALKRTITAGEMHNGQEKIFELQPVDKMMVRKSQWKVIQMFRSLWESLSFPEAKLEKGFRIDHYTKFRHGNRLWTMLLTLALLLLGIYDTIHFYNDSQLILSWILRSIGVMAGLILFGMTYTPMYHRYMQTLSVWLLSLLGIMMVHISIELKYYDQAYGVSCVLLYSCLVCQFLGLLFKSALGSSCLILVYYIVASSIRWGSFPLICIFLLIANTFYTRSAYSSEFYLRRDFLRLLKQQSEERRARQFLTNMLPANVVEEIRNNLPLIAHEREEASVLFTDIVSFTTLASRIAPEHVVAILNVVFSTFDSLTTKYNVYKVETIGDAYLACSGVVYQHPKHTHDLVDCALEFQLATRGFETPDHQRIVVRIGIHTGFVIAGVVGKKMPRYHLFGETVTTAEEMENKGLPGCVVVSGATYDHLDFQFDCERLTDLRIARHSHQKPAPKSTNNNFKSPSIVSASSIGASPKIGAHDARGNAALSTMGSSPKHATQASMVGSPNTTANKSSQSPLTPGSNQAALRGRFGVPKNDDGFETMARYRVRGRHGNNAPQPFRTPVRIRSAAPTPPAVAAASAAIAATLPATTTTSAAATSTTTNNAPTATVVAGNGGIAAGTAITTTSSTAVLPSSGVPPRPTSATVHSNHGLMVSAASSHNLPTGNSNGGTTATATANGNAPPHTPVSVGGVHLTASSQFTSGITTPTSSAGLLPSSSPNLVLVPNLTVQTAGGPASPRQTITPLAVGQSPAATLGQPSPANVVHNGVATPLSPIPLHSMVSSSSNTSNHTIASAGGITLASVPSNSIAAAGIRGDMSPTGMTMGMNGSPVGWKGASLDSPLLGSNHINSSGGMGSARGRNALPSLSTTLMHASTSSINGHGILHHSGSHNNSFNGPQGAPTNNGNGNSSGIGMNGHIPPTSSSVATNNVNSNASVTLTATSDKSHLDITPPTLHHLPGQPSATAS